VRKKQVGKSWFNISSESHPDTAKKKKIFILATNTWGAFALGKKKGRLVCLINIE